MHRTKVISIECACTFVLTCKFRFISVQAHVPYPWHQMAFLRTKTEPESCCYSEIISDFTCPLPSLWSAFLRLTMACLYWFLFWSWLFPDWGFYPPDLSTASSWLGLFSADPLVWAWLAAAVCSSVPTSSHPNYLFPGPFLSVCTALQSCLPPVKNFCGLDFWNLCHSVPTYSLHYAPEVWTRGVKKALISASNQVHDNYPNVSQHDLLHISNGSFLEFDREPSACFLQTLPLSLSMHTYQSVQTNCKQFNV